VFHTTGPTTHQAPPGGPASVATLAVVSGIGGVVTAKTAAVLAQNARGARGTFEQFGITSIVLCAAAVSGVMLGMMGRTVADSL